MSETVLDLFRRVIADEKAGKARRGGQPVNNLSEQNRGVSVQSRMKSPSLEEPAGAVLHDQAARTVDKITAHVHIIAEHGDETELQFIERMTRASAEHSRRKRK